MMRLSEQRWTSGVLALMFLFAAGHQERWWAIPLVLGLIHSLRWLTLMFEADPKERD